MQSAAQRQLSEAELRRLALRVYDGKQSEAQNTAAKAAKEAEAIKAAEARSLKIQLLVCIAALFVLIMGYMFINTQVTMIGYEINKQVKLNDELQNENNRLVLQIEQATSPEKVATFAAEHFNMVSPTEETVIYYDTTNWQTESAPVVRTGMAVDAKSIGYGTLELVDDDESGGLLGMLGSLIEQITADDTVSLGMRN